jgi:hypothetical protein
VDAEEEVAVANIGHATVVGSVGFARPALGVVEEARGLVVGELERTMRFRRPAQIVAIQLVEEALVGELAARAHCVVAVSIVPAALWQRHLVGLRGSRTRLISAVV